MAFCHVAPLSPTPPTQAGGHGLCRLGHSACKKRQRTAVHRPDTFKAIWAIAMAVGMHHVMTIGLESFAPFRALARPALLGLATAVLCAAITAPALAAKSQSKPAKQRLVLDTPITPFQPQIGEFGRFAFTAPGAPSQPQTLSSAFRFTPSGQAENRRALSLGVAARVTTPVLDRSKAAAPVDQFVVPQAYGVAVSLGWKGFGVDTGYTHAEPTLASPITGLKTDAVNLGLSYGGAKWRTRLEGMAEQNQQLALTPLSRRYSLELGGLYRVAPRFSVTGGVRYRIAPEPPSLLLPNRDDQAVYLGTSIAF